MNTDDFAAFCADVQGCLRCPAMEGRLRVMSPANGALAAKVLFLAEAPGRFGGDRTGVPMTSDRSGRTFRELLAGAGFAADEVFVSNAVLCNPRDDAGRNRPPSTTEITNCADHLARLIALLNPPIIATLGAVALTALHRLAPHGLVLRSAVAQPHEWNGRVLFPLYHPGPRALIHRPLMQHSADYAALRQLLLRP